MAAPERAKAGVPEAGAPGRTRLVGRGSGQKDW